MKAIFLILLSVFCLSTEVENSDKREYKIFKSADFKEEGPNEIEVKLNDWFIIELLSSPTTGYEWKLGNYNELEKLHTNSTNGEGVYMEDEVDQGVTGASGKDRYYFNAKSAGEETLKLRYARHWEDFSLISYDVVVHIVK